MRTLASRFSDLRAANERALILFVTAGDPSLGQLPAILDTLAEGGADAIEVGLPFSDPFGEGPTIQASSQRSLDAGTTVSAVLDVLGARPWPVPILTMGYVNPVMRMGYGNFARRSAACGITGTILSDLVPDEADPWDAAAAEAGLETVYLAAPTSTESRLREVARRATGFVYAVSRTGVTGTENAVPADVGLLVQRIRAQTPRPICVGFGISTPEHVRMVCEISDGAVVGSALVRLLHERWKDGAGREEILNFVRELKQATR